MKLYLLLVALLVGCSSTERTKYQAYKKGEGYRERNLDDGLKVINFKANRYTTKSYAEKAAKFRAIEICLAQKKKFAHILGVHDQSESETVTRSSSNVYGFPSYYYGMHPFYNRHSSFGLYGGINTVSTNSWRETLTFPEIDVIYRCTDVVAEPEVIFREVPAEEMKHLVKDLYGAVQVEKILPESPNKKHLIYGDILLKGNGERIQKTYQVLNLFSQGQKEVPIQILREGERMGQKLKSKDVSQDVAKSQQGVIDSACQEKEFKDEAICR